MEKRPLGNTDQKSSIVTLGCCALADATQEEANEIVDMAVSKGVNHFDVAPTYGDAELKLKPSLENHRDKVFLACKTQKRKEKEAAEELKESMHRMGVDYIDLYQFHALDDSEELEAAFGPNGALQAMLKAREEDLIGNIGITSHRPQAIMKAMEKFDLDTAMLPVNFVLKKHKQPENNYEPVLKTAGEKDIGIIAIKTFAKDPWPENTDEEEHPYSTWYRPFDDRKMIEKSLRFTLSQPHVTTLTSPCDPQLTPKVLNAAENIEELTEKEEQKLLDKAQTLEPLFPQ